MSKLNKLKQDNSFLKEIACWIKCPQLIKILGKYGAEVDKIYNSEFLGDAVRKLQAFTSDEWDYRKKQLLGGERWKLKNDALAQKNEKAIIKMAESLGMIGVTKPESADYDYILILGGGRMQNLYRPEMAKYILDKYKIINSKVIALSSFRQIEMDEKKYASKYSEDAATEFDAMVGGLKKTFGLREKKTIKQHNTGKLKTSSRVIKFNALYNYNNIYCLAAPGKEKKDRADTQDTYSFFIDEFNVKKGSSILAITSSIYVPAQFLQFVEYGIENKLEFETIGQVEEISKHKYVDAIYYLQEVKATIDHISRLCDKYEIIDNYKI